VFLNVYAYAYDQLVHFAASLTHAGIGATENAGVENAGADCRDGKCRSNPYR